MSSSPLLPVDQLVPLRLMLQDAVLRAKSAGRYTRGRAVVALDATVERAAHLVATQNNLVVGPKATLSDLHSKLVPHFGETWKQSVWPQIQQLREARNSVQHKGLEPDRDYLPTWIQATEAYVTSLIQAAYEIDLRRIALADAVQDPTRSDLVRQASEALANGDVASSVRCSLKAYDGAVDKWIRLHGRSYKPPMGTYLEGGLFGGEDHQDAEIKRLRRATAESSFAPSGAEHEWLQSARRDRASWLDEDDAERILHFAFSWIAAFEVAEREWVTDRHHRAAVNARKVRGGPGPAQVEEFKPPRVNYGGIEVCFQLKDVPQDDVYDDWARALSQLLTPDPGSAKHWAIGQDGTITLTTSPPTQPTAEDTDLLQEMLERVEVALAERARAAAQRVQDLINEADRHNATVAGIRDRLPPWVESITWQSARSSSEEACWAFTVTAEAANLDEPAWLPDIIRRHEKVTACFWLHGHRSLGLTPILDTNDLLKVLESADVALQNQLTVATNDKAAEQQMLAEISTAIRLSLAQRAHTR